MALREKMWMERNTGLLKTGEMSLCLVPFGGRGEEKVVCQL